MSTRLFVAQEGCHVTKSRRPSDEGNQNYSQQGFSPGTWWDASILPAVVHVWCVGRRSVKHHAGIVSVDADDIAVARHGLSHNFIKHYQKYSRVYLEEIAGPKFPWKCFLSA